MKELTAKEQAEVSRIQAHLGSVYVGYEERTTRRIAHELVKYGMWFWNGRSLFAKVRHLGVGVYGVSIDEKASFGLAEY